MSLEDYDFDYEALVYPSQFNPAPARDGLSAWWLVQQYASRSDFDRDQFCRRCHNWDARRSLDKGRPHGTMDPNACNGCVLSFLDPRTINTKTQRDRLFTAYCEARARVEDHEDERDRAQFPKDKKRWKKRQRRLKEALSAAREACRRCGFDPAKKLRRFRRLLIIDEKAWAKILPRKTAEELDLGSGARTA